MLPTAQEFRYLRKKAGLTQDELAEKAGLSQSLVARIEKGDIDTKLSTAQRLLDVIKGSEKKSRSLSLKDCMASPVVYCKPSDTVKRAVAMMEEHGISQMPVIENGKAVGSLLDTHLVQVLAKKGARGKSLVSDAMSRPFPELGIDSPMDKAVKLLTRGPAVLIRRGQHVAGIVTKADVLRLML